MQFAKVSRNVTDHITILLMAGLRRGAFHLSRKLPITQIRKLPMDSTSNAYLVGSGIGSLAAAAFMIRDAGIAGENISILESEGLSGGSLDAAGDSAVGYSMRGGRMFTGDNYECTWTCSRRSRP